MDDLALRYLLLCLRLERLSPGFVDSYIGPRELKEAVALEPLPLPSELHDEAMSLRALAADRLSGEAAYVCRGRWLDGQLRAIAALARQAGGEEIAYLDFVEQLYGVPVTPVPESELMAARQRLDRALPGDGSLGERQAAFSQAQRVPADQVMRAMVASAGRFRLVTLRDFDLPPDEAVEWEEAHDQPWGAYAEFVGNGRTRILINVDLPLDVAAIAYLASHEAYPGHHAEIASKERSLVAAGIGEATLRTMNTPEAMLAEGQADVAGEVVMGDHELAAELQAIGREVGLAGDWVRAVEVHRATRELSAAIGNAALMLHHEGRSAAEVRAWLSDISPQEPERLDHILRMLSDPVLRTYPFSYTLGAGLVRAWLEVTGQTAGFARLLSEQLSPAQLQAETASPSGV